MARVHYKLSHTAEGVENALYLRYELLCALRNKLIDNEQETREYIAMVAKWATSEQTKCWLFLTGGVGTGKTTLATALKKTLESTTYKNGYIDCAVLVGMINATELDKEGFQNRINEYRYIIVDDLGQEALEVKEYGNSKMPFVELANRLYEQGKPLIVTSNLTMEEIGQRYGERVADRIREMAEVITFKGKSHRV